MCMMYSIYVYTCTQAVVYDMLTKYMYISFFTVTEHVIQPNIPQESEETNPSRVCFCVYMCANRISKSICVVGLFA